MNMVKKFDEYINENVRDIMKPKSNDELKDVIKKYFDEAEEGNVVSVKIDEGESWMNAAEAYHLYDSFYVYNDYIYTFDFVEYLYQYQLIKTDETALNFKEKLEKALKKL